MNSYGNKELASDYLKEMRKDLVEDGTSLFMERNPYVSISKLIAAAKPNIPAMYRKEGNLKKLFISGVGPKTTSVLERILDEKFGRKE